MSNYWDPIFLKHLNNIKYIFEVGSRYGDESIKLSKTFLDSTIWCFECNPITVNICENNLKKYSQIKFFNFGLGDKNEIKPFYSFVKNNDGASSFFKRIDHEETQICTGNVKIIKLNDFVKEYNISYIDLLCMDIQGFELNVLKGCEKFIKNIRYIIMEEPKKIINPSYLPENTYSKYINAPSHDDIKLFMENNGFIEIERIQENEIEDNVMYKNINFKNI
jgi:FkbM family methyltransferase